MLAFVTSPESTKHLYTICAMLVQRCSVFAGSAINVGLLGQFLTGVWNSLCLLWSVFQNYIPERQLHCTCIIIR